MATTPVETAAVPRAVILEARDTEERISPLAVGSWALYDFANTMFSMNIVSTYFPLFIIALGGTDAHYSYPLSGALLIVALVMPLLGAMSDQTGRRLPWLAGFTALCISMTALMGLVSDMWAVIALFIAANIGYQVALVFYDALLPSVSTTLNWGKVSGLGVGLGYAGALVGLLAAAAIVGENGSKQLAFLPTAAMFLVFALPIFFFVKERKPRVERKIPEGERITWRNSFTQIWRTIGDARAVPGLLIFLVANFFYSDALNTVIIAMSVYSTEVIGFPSPTTVLAPAIIAAVLGSWLFGLVTDRLTSKQALAISLVLWIGVFLAAIFITDKAIFQWVIAPLAGVALGSTWTAARTMMVELSPPERLGEFMGIYNLTGKFSAVLGPALWGTTLLILNPDQYGHFAYQVAIGTLLLMVLVGFGLHLLTPNIRREKARS